MVQLLARCHEVWVGNEKQLDLMLAWLILAGHDCRYTVPARVVPIAGPVSNSVDKKIPSDFDHAEGDSTDSLLTAFHGGQDWPWRQSQRWLDAFGSVKKGWSLSDMSGQERMLSFRDYLARLEASDILIELCDDNIERRYSQSFRMTDALCRGVPVIANRFLPLAGEIEKFGAGWLIDAPEELAPLLEHLEKHPASIHNASRAALELARKEFDENRVYRSLHSVLVDLLDRRPATGAGTPDLSALGGKDPSVFQAARQVLGHWFHHRIRKPIHGVWRRIAANRPRASDEASASWIVVSRSDLFPTNHGAAVKIERTAWGLSHHVGSVILLTDRRDCYWVYQQGQRRERRFPFWLRLLGWPRALGLFRLMVKGMPYSNAFLYLPLVDRSIQLRLLWLMKQYPVEVVQAEFPAYAHPAVWASRLFGTASLMVEHNVEFQRIEQQVPELGSQGARWLRRIEIDLANACDHVITVSDRDRDHLIAAGVREGKVVTVPHGVDLQYFEQAEPLDLRAQFNLPADHAVLVYHGIYSYPPNLEAVEELSERLIPALARRGVMASVVAFGPEPPGSKLPGVTFAGPVDNLAAHLMGADLAVIPLRAGGGTRMKILDDFAARVPVVTTSKGMEGLKVTDGVELRIVDDPEAMADVVRDLLRDEAARKALADRAHAWVSALDWRAIAGRYVARVRGVS
jgi:glycosyltransferase involved in cell wall biosynthesis